MREPIRYRHGSAPSASTTGTGAATGGSGQDRRSPATSSSRHPARDLHRRETTMTSEIEQYSGALISDVTLPALVAQATDDGGLRSLSITVDLTSLGGDDWTYDSVIEARDGKVSILFFDDRDAQPPAARQPMIGPHSGA